MRNLFSASPEFAVWADHGETGRQIPYALGQFTVHEYCNEIAYRNMSEETKRNLSHLQRSGISLGSGVVAGVAAAVLSQPADTLLSQVRHSSKSGVKETLLTERELYKDQ